MGKSGEELAASFLERKGFRILERNYRCRLGEIDLIAEKERALFFVEVKTRMSTEVVSPHELISREKQRHLSRAARFYLAQRGWQERPADFALLVIDGSGREPVCEWIEGAFWSCWGY